MKETVRVRESKLTLSVHGQVRDATSDHPGGIAEVIDGGDPE